MVIHIINFAYKMAHIIMMERQYMRNFYACEAAYNMTCFF